MKWKMIFEEAIEMMKTSTSVEDWNKKRDVVKHHMHPMIWEKVYKVIDTEGFITKTLKANQK